MLRRHNACSFLATVLTARAEGESSKNRGTLWAFRVSDLALRLCFLTFANKLAFEIDPIRFVFTVIGNGIWASVIEKPSVPGVANVHGGHLRIARSRLGRGHDPIENVVEPVPKPTVVWR